MKRIFFHALIISLFLPLAQNQAPLLAVLHLAKVFVNPYAARFIENGFGKTECAEDLKTWVNDIFELKFWALRMLDANPKMNSGISEGNFRHFGSFDACVSISENVTGKIMKGKHCTIPVVVDDDTMKYFFHLGMNLLKDRIKINIPVMDILREKHVEIASEYVKMIFTLCIPQSCTSEDLDQLFTRFVKKFKLPAKLIFDENFCFYKNKPVVSYPIDFYSYMFFAIVVVLVMAGTTYDVVTNDKTPTLLKHFSIYSNFKKLTSTEPEPDDITCRHGLKVIAVFWTILWQAGLTKGMSPISNEASLALFADSEFAQFTSLAGIGLAIHYAWDTALAISGLTVMYKLLQNSEKNNGRWLWCYLVRFFKCTPPLLATILIYISVVKHFFQGPLWPFLLEKFATNCVNHSWSTLLGTSNSLTYDKMCMGQSWYWSMDSQLYILAPFVFLFFKKLPSYTFIGILVICANSIYDTAVKVEALNLGFLMPFEMSERDGTFVHQNTYSRAPAWLIGVCCGYLLHTYKENIRFSKKMTFWVWANALSVIGGLVLYHGIFIFEESNTVRSIFLNAISRPLWALSICFIIICCSTNHGGFVNTFLSHPSFIILSKISYCLFLTYFGVIDIVFGNRKGAENIDVIKAFCECCGFTLILFGSSVFLWLFFEAPVVSFITERKMPREEKEESHEKTD